MPAGRSCLPANARSRGPTNPVAPQPSCPDRRPTTDNRQPNYGRATPLPSTIVTILFAGTAAIRSVWPFGQRISIESAFAYTANGGRYVLVSVVKGSIGFVDADFHRKELTLLGSRNATAEDFERVIGAMREGRVPAHKWITHRTSLTGAVRDLPNWAANKSGLVKAVIELGG